MMDWFIEKVLLRNSHANRRHLDRADIDRQGSQVKEDDPIRLHYQRKRLVSRGPFTTISTAIYHSSDPHNSGAPKYVEDGKFGMPTLMSYVGGLTLFIEGVTHLVNVEADLSRIPPKKIPRIKGADGKMYYTVDYAIQVTYLSAYTSYELVSGGVNYGLVTSEYV